MSLVDDPITRKELFLSYLNGNTDITLPEPITREELYLSYLCGNTGIKLPEPITRIELYLYSLCVNGGVPGGGNNNGDDGGDIPPNPSDVEIVSWADGTDAQIAAMAQALRAGTISVEDTDWEVGQERIVHLSAIKSEYMGNHVAQTQTLVILHKGGKLLENGEECSFVVGLKNCLTNGATLENFGMNSSRTSVGGWGECRMRAGCNSDFIDMIPSKLQPAFSLFQNITADGTGSSIKTSIDLFELAAEKEVFGENFYADSTAETDLFQFDYYKVPSNRMKKAGNNGAVSVWWERSPYYAKNDGFCRVDIGGGFSDYGYADTKYGVAPYGCI